MGRWNVLAAFLWLSVGDLLRLKDCSARPLHVMIDTPTRLMTRAFSPRNMQVDHSLLPSVAKSIGLIFRIFFGLVPFQL